jgi:hypothetical protein
MTVEQFAPSTSNSVASTIATLDIPSKMFKEQYQEVVTSYHKPNRAEKVGVANLG